MTNFRLGLIDYALFGILWFILFAAIALILLLGIKRMNSYMNHLFGSSR